ncbi:MAG: hypothetical protein ACYCX4_02640 [Bacillota bacterium]
MADKKPTVGRIVHFKTEEGETLPAIISKVEDDVVYLRVFTNDPGRPAPLFEGVKQGKKKGQWDWPPRDGE